MSTAKSPDSFTFTVGKLGMFYVTGKHIAPDVCPIHRRWNGRKSSQPVSKRKFIMYSQILLGERAHLIEFPSILLPPGATTGSIVNIAVHQNYSEEQKREKEFWDLQDAILKEFGGASPEPPKLSVRFFPDFLGLGCDLASGAERHPNVRHS